MKTKTKLTIAVASVLSVATLAGTGYAGWVLSHNVSQNKNGSMEAYGVADKTVTLEILDFDDPKAIVWGKTIKDSTLQHSWFGSTGDDVKTEAFNPALNFTVTNTETDDHKEPVIESATITVIDSGNAYKDCLTNNLITGVPANDKGEFVANIKAGIALTEKETPSNVFTYKLNLQAVAGTNLFGWGTAFENKNPVNYYNQFSAEDVKETSTTTNTTYFADAKKKMERIEKLNKLSFRIDLTVNHASL